MKRLLAAVLLCCWGVANAAPVTIDFEEFTVGDTFDGWFSSQGYEFIGGASPGCTQFGCPAEIVTGVSGSNSLQAFSGFFGQDGFGAEAGISMRRVGGGAFAIQSLDLVLEGCAGGGASCGGSESITGTLFGGGAADLSVPVGTGDWLNLERLNFEAEGDCCGFGTGTVVQLDNIVVNVVPIGFCFISFSSTKTNMPTKSASYN